MPKRHISHLFRFSRVKIKEISVADDRSLTMVKLEPNRRFLPIRSGCLKKVRHVHSYEVRAIRDLPMSQSMVVIDLHYRKVRCPDCGIPPGRDTMSLLHRTLATRIDWPSLSSGSAKI